MSSGYDIVNLQSGDIPPLPANIGRAALVAVGNTVNVRPVPPLASGLSITNASVTADNPNASKVVFAANISAKQRTIWNRSTTAKFYMRYASEDGEDATLTNSSIPPLLPNGYFEFPQTAGGQIYQGIVTGIWDGEPGAAAVNTVEGT